MRSRRVMTGRIRQYCVLFAAVVVLAVVWTVILPAVGHVSVVRTMILRNEALGIDPTAMFYTELENMRVQDGLLRRIDRP